MENPQQDRRERTHDVVQFVQEKQSEKSVVDLIPLNWLNENGNSCSYPKTKQYKHLEKWVCQCKIPEASWLHEQEIVTIKKCASYEKGLKRLERYLKTLDPGSTSATEGLSCAGASTQQYVSNILRRKTTGDAKQSEPKKKCDNKRRRESNNEQESAEIKAALMQLYEITMTQMEKVHDSIEYDIELKLQETETKILLNLGRPLGKGLSEDLRKLEITFPIVDHTIFETFDKALATNSVKSMALKNLMRSYGTTKDEVAKAVRAILPNIMGQQVQILYSGEGKRNSSLPAKRNFSANNTFACMSEVITNLLENSVTGKEICHRTGKWLKEASDRNGGRQARSVNVNVLTVT